MIPRYCVAQNTLLSVMDCFLCLQQVVLRKQRIPQTWYSPPAEARFVLRQKLCTVACLQAIFEVYVPKTSRPSKDSKDKDKGSAQYFLQINNDRGTVIFLLVAIDIITSVRMSLVLVFLACSYFCNLLYCPFNIIFFSALINKLFVYKLLFQNCNY